ncbi:MAG: tail fiber domain-containing protein [Candidatus Beckwithbacteria bacterium]|nr:tail fiber domain-containing protein [Candidatus Beckwithbacteria bacterium]
MDFNMGDTYREAVAHFYLLGKLREGTNPIRAYVTLVLNPGSTNTLSSVGMKITDVTGGSTFTSDHLVLVNTGTSAGSIYIEVDNRYNTVQILPLSIYGDQVTTFEFLSNQGIITSLPAGTQYTASYADQYANNIYTTGNVGIGTTSPTTAKLVVAGNIDLSGAIGGTGIIYMGRSATKTGLAFDTSNPNYGIFYRESSPDYVAISPNGGGDTNPVVYVGGDGNVGIGTTDPTDALAVVGDISLGGVDADAGYNLVFRSRSDEGLFESGYGLQLMAPDRVIIGIDSNANGTDASFAVVNNTTTNYGDLSLALPATALFVVQEAGNVGIGTTDPAVKLDVVGAVHTSRLGTYGTYSSTQVQGIWSISETYPIDTGGDDFGTQYGMGYSYNKNGGAPFASEHQIVFTNSGTVGAAIGFGGSGYFAGNVGIGTTAPGAKLDVASPASGVALKVGRYSGNPNIKSSDTHLIMDSNGDYLSLNHYVTDNVAIAIGGGNVGIGTATPGTAGLAVMNGNVGIGTTNPLSRFQVADSANLGRYLQTSSNGNTEIRLNNNAMQTVLTLSNAQSGAANYGTAIAFYHGYGGSSTALGTAVNSGKIVVGGEQSWTSTASTQDSYMAFQTTLNGAMAEKMRIDSNGNVGIGTTDPGQKLDVQSTGTNVYINAGSATQTSTSGLVLTSDTGTGQIWKAGSGYTTSYGRARSLNIYNSEDYPITFYQSTSERMRIDAGGNVGIGTTSPGYKLAVVGDGSVTSGEHFVSQNVASTSGNGIYLGYRSNGTSVTSALVRADNSLPITFGTTTTNQAMTILANGNVGIGTTNPGSKLEVKSTNAEDGIYISATTYPEVILYEGSTARGVLGVAGNAGGYLTGSIADSTVLYGVGALHFGANSAMAMTIATSGNVGIGTTAPTQDLQVVGTVLATDFTCTHCLDFPDFETTLDLDANRILNQSTYTWTQNFTDDTTTGLTYNANSLTSGTAVAISSTATAFTGTLVNITLSGTAAANTGTVWKVSSTGAANTGTVAMITNLGTGNSFRVNDQTGDADTTPFLIDETGKVGIGTAGPLSKLSVGGVGDATVTIYGTNTALGGTGVVGESTNATSGIGIQGLSQGTSGAGVIGSHSGGGYGVWGSSSSSDGGYFTSTSGYAVEATGGSYGIYATGSTMGGRFVDSGGSSTLYAAYGAWGIYTVQKGYFGGNVGIGTTNPNYELQVNGQIAADVGTAAAPGFIFSGSTDGMFSPGARVLGFSSFGTQKMTINAYGAGIVCADPDHVLEIGGTGAGCNTGTGSWIAAGSTAFTANSSREWKENIATFSIPDILTRFQNAKPRTFDWKAEYNTSPDRFNNLGFIAEEFYPVLQRGDNKYVNGQDVMIANWLATQALIDLTNSNSTQIASLSGQLAGLSLTDTGDLNIAKDQTGNYIVEKTESTFVKTTVDKVGAFADIITARLQAGLIQTKQLITDTLTVNNKIITPTVETEKLVTGFISPLPDNPTITIAADVSISGELTANTIKSSTIDKLREKIDLISTQLQDQTATASALPAQAGPTASPSAEILALLAQYQPAASPAANLDINSLTADFGFFSDYLAVMGKTVTTNLEVTDSLSVASIASPTNSLNLLAGMTGPAYRPQRRF